jgi:hypothetical protein
VEGVVLYFPSEGGQETLPTGDIFHRPVQEGGQQGGGGGRYTDVVDLSADDTSKPQQESLFRIYWQNRLVPETQLTKLSFFPEAKTWTQCNQKGIPHAWRHRIKGFLFFDANFHNISNNKLKLQVDPDLETWITSKRVENNSLFWPNTNIDKRFVE